MPELARWYIKTSLVYLAAALLVGVALAVHRMTSLVPVLDFSGPAYIHLFVVGWLTQLIFGVAYWLFPRFSKASPYGHEYLGWGAYVLLNAGLILRAVAEPATGVMYGKGWRVALIGAALCQWAAGLLFTVYIWPRVRAK